MMSDKTEAIRKQKEIVRKEIIRRLRDQDPRERENRSRDIQQELLSSEEYRNAETVMTYVSLTTEVSTKLINEEALKLGKRVAVPYMEPTEETIIASKLTAIKNLDKGPFGIFQPRRDLVEEIPPEEIDLIGKESGQSEIRRREGRRRNCHRVGFG